MIDTGVSQRANWRELTMSRGAGCLLAVAIAFAAGSAAAQTTTPSGVGDGAYGSLAGTAGSHRQNRPGDSGDKPKAKAPLAEVKMAPDPWPRLDPGAVFCRTEADLRLHLSAVAARLDGSSSRYAEAPGCRVIRTRTAVSVVSREGPGRTQVKLSDETGWTDAFLPDKKTGP